MGLLDTFSTSFLGGNGAWWTPGPAHAGWVPRLRGKPMNPMSWEDICRHADFRGRWVALDHCRYEEGSGRAVEGAVVDVDDDLVELCNRMRESERTNCAILFCGADGTQELPEHGSEDAAEDPFHHSAH